MLLRFLSGMPVRGAISPEGLSGGCGSSYDCLCRNPGVEWFLFIVSPNTGPLAAGCGLKDWQIMQIT